MIYNTMALGMIQKLNKVCTNEGCGLKIMFISFKNHVLICPHRVVQCEYVEMGCVWKDKFMLMKDHTSGCAHKTGFELAMKLKDDHEKFKTLSENLTKRLEPLEEWFSSVRKLQSKLSRYITMKEKARVGEIYAHRRLMMPFGTEGCVRTTQFHMFTFTWEIGIEELKRDGEYGLYMKRISTPEILVRSHASDNPNRMNDALPLYTIVKLWSHTEDSDEWVRVSYQENDTFVHRYSRKHPVSGISLVVCKPSKNHHPSLCNLHHPVYLDLECMNMSNSILFSKNKSKKKKKKNKGINTHTQKKNVSLH